MCWSVPGFRSDGLGLRTRSLAKNAVRVVCPFVVLVSNGRSDLQTNVEVLGIILEGFGSCAHGFFEDFVPILFRLLHRFLILWGSLDGGFFGGFRFDF